MKGKRSYYKILGVSENASNFELRKAFCKLSKELHPDTTSLELEDAKFKFQQVIEAYENLNNIKLRNVYDKKLKETKKSSNKNNINFVNTFAFDSNNQNLVGNRRPFSSGEMFSLFLLIIVIIFSLLLSLVVAYSTGTKMDTIPTWLSWIIF